MASFRESAIRARQEYLQRETRALNEFVGSKVDWIKKQLIRGEKMCYFEPGSIWSVAHQESYDFSKPETMTRLIAEIDRLTDGCAKCVRNGNELQCELSLNPATSKPVPKPDSTSESTSPNCRCI